MSECAGDNCTHPECTRNEPRPTAEELDTQIRDSLNIPPEKWAVMNRAERRAATRGRRRG